MNILELDKDGILLQRGNDTTDSICITEDEGGVYTQEYRTWKLWKLWVDFKSEEEKAVWYENNPEPKVKYKENNS